MSPLFSILTVCYNSEKTIERTIQSVLNQTCKDFEYIIIDGASSDGTREIISRYKHQIQKIVSEPDGGIYEAMNKGLHLASGEIIGIINSDDWYEPNTLELVADAFNNSDKETVFHGLCKYHFNDKEGDIHAYHHSVLPSKNIAHPTCFVPKKLYLKFGNFDITYKVAADYEFLLRLYLKGVSFKRIDRVLANFQYGGFSESNSSSFDVLEIHRLHRQIGRRKYYSQKLKYSLNRLLSRYF